MDKFLILAWAKEYIQIDPKLGAQVGFYSDGKVEIHSFGSANNESLFDIASVSKAFMTSYLCMIAVEKNLLTLGSKVSEFFPCSKDVGRITIEQILSHTSGLIAWLPMYGLVDSKEQAREYLFNLSIDESLKGKRVYSDIGFMILGFILEEVFKESIDEVFQKYILIPLDLKNTYFESTLTKDSLPTSNGNPFEKQLIQDRNIATKKKIDWRERLLIKEVNDFNCSSVFKGSSGHCGLFSNSLDLLELSRSLIDNRIVSKKTRDSFLERILEKNSLGFLADPHLLKFNLSKLWRGHHGFTGCSTFFNTKTSTAFSFLSNRQVAGLNGKKYHNWKLT